MVIVNGGGGSSGPVIIYSSTTGSDSSTSVATGFYSGSEAKIVKSHAGIVTKVGPVFRPYDPVITSLLSMEF